MIGLWSLAVILLFSAVVTPDLRPAHPSVEWVLLVNWQQLEGDQSHKCNAVFNRAFIFLSTPISLSVVVPADNLTSGIFWNCHFEMYERVALDFVQYLSWTVIDTSSRYVECQPLGWMIHHLWLAEWHTYITNILIFWHCKMYVIVKIIQFWILCFMLETI